MLFSLRSKRVLKWLFYYLVFYWGRTLSWDVSQVNTCIIVTQISFYQQALVEKRCTGWNGESISRSTKWHIKYVHSLFLSCHIARQSWSIFTKLWAENRCTGWTKRLSQPTQNSFFSLQNPTHELVLWEQNNTWSRSKLTYNRVFLNHAAPVVWKIKFTRF